MKAIVLAATAASLAACSVGPAAWQAETVPVVVITQTPKSSKCPPIGAGIVSEASRMTPLEPMPAGGIDALTAALMRSEVEKNARLHQAVMAYERCKGRPLHTRE